MFVCVCLWLNQIPVITHPPKTQPSRVFSTGFHRSSSSTTVGRATFIDDVCKVSPRKTRFISANYENNEFFLTLFFFVRSDPTNTQNRIEIQIQSQSIKQANTTTNTTKQESKRARKSKQIKQHQNHHVVDCKLVRSWFGTAGLVLLRAGQYFSQIFTRPGFFLASCFLLLASCFLVLVSCFLFLVS